MKKLLLIPVLLVLGACHPLLPQDPAGPAGSAVVEVHASNGWTWYRTPAWTPGRNITFGVVPPSGPSNGQTVLVVHSSLGLGGGDLALAEQYATQGYTAAVVSWFASAFPTYNSPAFTGQSYFAVGDLNATVTALKSVVPQPVALVGISRGAGIVGLRAAQGHDEPVVLFSCPCTHPLAWGAMPFDDFPARYPASIEAPVYVWGAGDDNVTPPATQTGWFVIGLIFNHGVDVTYRVDPTGGHAFPYNPTLTAETAVVTAGWIADHQPTAM